MGTGVLPAAEGGQETCGTGNNKFHFLQAGVLGLNCRRASKLCFPAFRLQAGSCVRSGRQQAEDLRSWAGVSSPAVEDGQADGPRVSAPMGCPGPPRMSHFSGGFLCLIVTFLL